MIRHDDPTQPSGLPVAESAPVTRSTPSVEDICAMEASAHLRDGFWTAHIPGIAHTEANGLTREEAVAGAWRRAAIRIAQERRRFRDQLERIRVLAGAR